MRANGRNRLHVRAILLIFCGLHAFLALEFLADWLAAGPHEAIALYGSPEWAHEHVGLLSRALNVLAGMVVTAIALVIPITSSLYTPKFIEVFLRDRVNQVVLGFFILGLANGVYVDYWIREEYSPVVAVTVLQVQFGIGVAVVLPYYFYVFRSIGPTAITAVLAERTGRRIRVLAGSAEGTAAEKTGLRRRIVHLGNFVLRSLDRSDRDSALEAVGALVRVLRHYVELRGRFPEAWLRPEPDHFKGLSDEGLRSLERDGTWVERTTLHQLQLAYQAALDDAPDMVSEIGHAVEEVGLHAHRADDPTLLRLVVRFFNSFMREAIKTGDLHAIYDVLEPYRSLAETLVAERPATAVAIARHLRYYAELAHATETPFVAELIGYDLSRLVRAAYGREATDREAILEHLLDLRAAPPGRKSFRLVKAKILLAAYLADRGHADEANRLLEACLPIGADLVDQMRRDFAAAADEPEFWEVTDRQVHFDHVPPEHRDRVEALLDDLEERASTD